MQALRSVLHNRLNPIWPCLDPQLKETSQQDGPSTDPTAPPPGEAPPDPFLEHDLKRTPRAGGGTLPPL